MQYYRFFPAKFKEKTLSLNPYQDGCYRRLIDEYMMNRLPFPNSEAALARLCGISLQEWNDNACGILLAYFEHRNGLLFNKTCDEELAYQDEISKFRSEKSKKAAKVRWNKNKDLNATSIPQAMPDDARVKSQELSIDSSKLESIKLIGFDRFWNIYPKQRAASKEKAKIAYRKALTRATGEEIFQGCLKYSASDEVRNGYAKGCAAWLNDDRWKVDYSRTTASGGTPKSYSQTIMGAMEGAMRTTERKSTDEIY